MIQLKVPAQLVPVLRSGANTCLCNQTLLNCIDNSGAAIVECVQLLRMKRAARIGKPLLEQLEKLYNISFARGVKLTPLRLN